MSEFSRNNQEIEKPEIGGREILLEIGKVGLPILVLGLIGRYAGSEGVVNLAENLIPNLPESNRDSVKMLGGLLGFLVALKATTSIVRYVKEQNKAVETEGRVS